jgi:hypothetical protein
MGSQLLERGEYVLTPSRNCSIRWTDAQAGPKLLERRYQEPFGHDVSELLHCGYMHDSELPKSDLLMDKLEIKLSVLGAIMMHRVGRHVHEGDVVVVENRGLRP